MNALYEAEWRARLQRLLSGQHAACDLPDQEVADVSHAGDPSGHQGGVRRDAEAGLRRLPGACDRGLLVEPGAGSQVLHREEDPFHFMPLPRPNLVTASMWAHVRLHRGERRHAARPGQPSLAGGSCRAAKRRSSPPRCRRAPSCSGPVASCTVPAPTGRTSCGTACSSRSRSDGCDRRRTTTSRCPSRRRSRSAELRELIGYRMHTGLGFSEVYW